jgi:adenylylsulfate kinase-like enzyme
MARDTKGLYSQNKAGNLPNVVGVDIPWHAPITPNMVVETEESTPETIAQMIVDSVPKLKLLYRK